MEWKWLNRPLDRPRSCGNRPTRRSRKYFNSAGTLERQGIQDSAHASVNRFVFAAAATLLLAACSGGSGSGPRTATTANLVEVTSPSSEGAIWIDDWSPNFRFDELVHIGSGVAETILPVGVPYPRALGSVYSKVRHDNAPVWHENVRNGTSKQRLADYLEADAAEDDGRLRRFGDRPPVIRAVAGTSDDHWRALRFAVQVLNDSLPRDWQLRISDERAFVPYANREPAKGEIIVHFEPQIFWPAGTCGPTARGCASSRISGDEITRGIVRVDYEDLDLATLRSVVLHELIHILGRNHPDPYDFPESVMRTPRRENNGFLLSQLDRDALFAVYDRLDPGTRAHAIYTELGPWEDRSEVIFGRLAIRGGHIWFGAAHRNGLTQSWANGPYPGRRLEDNTALSGSATWSGRLLGFTPSAEPVAGTAALTVRLASLTGRMGFTDMEKWRAKETIGAIGTGTIWRDGDLYYPMKVSGNSFWRTWESGDDGVVEGTFLGIAHEGMAGTLKRDDLTAGFGGIRD